MKRLLLFILLLLVLIALSGCYSCKTFNTFWGKEIPAGSEGKFMWDKECRQVLKVEPIKPAPFKPAPVKQGSACGPNIVTMYHPCESKPVVRVDKEMPREAQVNKAFNYTITITNLTQCLMTDITVIEKMSEGFQFQSSSPQGQLRGSDVVWSIKSLDGGEVIVLQVTGIAADVKCLRNCTTITYAFALCANVSVVKPSLTLSKTAPDAVMLCDTIPYTFVVTNTGTGLAENVKITDMLPEGLKTTDRLSQINIDAGDLAPGQSKQFVSIVQADRTGRYINRASATSTNGSSAQSESVATLVRQPVLSITKTGPQRQYIGKEMTYEITVTNRGDADALDTVVVDSLPEGIRTVKVSAGATVVNGKVTWAIGTLSARTSKKFTVMYTPVKAADFVNEAQATATCADSVSDRAVTTVTGVAAILLEVIDVSDPIEVGDNETYIITVTNQGSAPDNNIIITCTLEDSQTYVSSTGPSVGTSIGNQIRFAPLKTLPPNSKATWQVVVKAVKAGDVRFKVSMQTDELDRPVEETEATRHYE